MTHLKRLARIIIKTAATATAVAVAAVFPLLVSAQSSGTTLLKNPTSFTDIQSFIAAFLQAVVEISLPILTIFIVYSGFLFIAARGEPAKLNKAKDNLLYVVLGAILILGAWVLATLIGSTVSQIVGTS